MTEATGTRSSVMHGVIVMVAFGLVWAVLGISGLPVPAPVVVVLVLAAAAAAVATYRAAHRFRAGAGAGAAEARPRRPSPAAGRTFGLVNLAQTVLILGAVVGLGRAGSPGLIPAAVCLVVGLHFLPLARVFDVPEYWWTGGGLIVVAVVGGVAFAGGVSDATVRSAVGLPAAAVLWCTSVLVARRG